jgi:hypothetical protein
MIWRVGGGGGGLFGSTDLSEPALVFLGEGAPVGDDAKREARNVGIVADQAWDLASPASKSKSPA